MVATTMTIIVVFIPVAFMGGIPGKFLKQFGLTVAAAVFFSLVVARMLTPLMAAYLLKPVKHSDEKTAIMRLYDKSLLWSLRHRFITVAVGALFFGASIVLFKMMPTSVIGSVDRGESIISVQMPPGTPIESTRQTVERLTTLMLKHPDTKNVFVSIGSATQGRGRSSTGSAGEVNKATMYVTLKPRDKRKLSQQEFEDDIRPTLNYGSRPKSKLHGKRRYYREVEAGSCR